MRLKKKSRRAFFYNSFFNKLVSSLVTLSFIVTSVVLPPSSFAEIASHSTGSGQAPAPRNDTLFPQDLGTIEESFDSAQDKSFKGTSDKTIIFIQDAHDSLEAQQNIAKIIGSLVKEQGITTVFEEGYEGPVPTDEFFGSIKEADVKEKVSYFFLDQLRIGAAEYAHINRKDDFKLIGADSSKLHLENIAWAQKNSKVKAETEKDIAELSKYINKLASQYFPKEIKEWMKLRERFDNKQLSLLDYISRLMKVLGSPSPSLSHEGRGTDTKPSPLMGEGKGDGEIYPSISLLLASQTSKDPALLEKVKVIDSKTLFAELGKAEDDLAKAHLKDERGEKVFHYHSQLSLLSRLNRLEVTPDEYEVSKNSLKDLNTAKLAEFIVKETRKSLVLSTRWEKNIQNAVGFYETAKARDTSIEGALKSFKSDPNEKIAILVFGGFHKAGVKEILKKEGFSYTIIAPRISKEDPRHKASYQELMSAGYHPYELANTIARSSRPESIFQVALTLGKTTVQDYIKQLADYVMKKRQGLADAVLSKTLTKAVTPRFAMALATVGGAMLAPGALPAAETSAPIPRVAPAAGVRETVPQGASYLMDVNSPQGLLKLYLKDIRGNKLIGIQDVAKDEITYQSLSNFGFGSIVSLSPDGKFAIASSTVNAVHVIPLSGFETKRVHIDNTPANEFYLFDPTAPVVYLSGLPGQSPLDSHLVAAEFLNNDKARLTATKGESYILTLSTMQLVLEVPTSSEIPLLSGSSDYFHFGFDPAQFYVTVKDASGNKVQQTLKEALLSGALERFRLRLRFKGPAVIFRPNGERAYVTKRYRGSYLITARNVLEDLPTELLLPERLRKDIEGTTLDLDKGLELEVTRGKTLLGTVTIEPMAGSSAETTTQAQKAAASTDGSIPSVRPADVDRLSGQSLGAVAPAERLAPSQSLMRYVQAGLLALSPLLFFELPIKAGEQTPVGQRAVDQGVVDKIQAAVNSGALVTSIPRLKAGAQAPILNPDNDSTLQVDLSAFEYEIKVGTETFTGVTSETLNAALPNAVLILRSANDTFNAFQYIPISTSAISDIQNVPYSLKDKAKLKAPTAVDLLASMDIDGAGKIPGPTVGKGPAASEREVKIATIQIGALGALAGQYGVILTKPMQPGVPADSSKVRLTVDVSGVDLTKAEFLVVQAQVSTRTIMTPDKKKIAPLKPPKTDKTRRKLIKKVQLLFPGIDPAEVKDGKLVVDVEFKDLMTALYGDNARNLSPTSPAIFYIYTGIDRKTKKANDLLTGYDGGDLSGPIVKRVKRLKGNTNRVVFGGLTVEIPPIDLVDASDEATTTAKNELGNLFSWGAFGEDRTARPIASAETLTDTDGKVIRGIEIPSDAAGNKKGLFIFADDSNTGDRVEIGNLLQANNSGFVFAAQFAPQDPAVTEGIVLRFDIKDFAGKQIYYKTMIAPNMLRRLKASYISDLLAKAGVNLEQGNSVAFSVTDEKGKPIPGKLTVFAPGITDRLNRFDLAETTDPLTNAKNYKGEAFTWGSAARRPLIGGEASVKPLVTDELYQGQRAVELDLDDTGLTAALTLNADNFTTPKKVEIADLTDPAQTSNPNAYVIGVKAMPRDPAIQTVVFKLEFEESKDKHVVFQSQPMPANQFKSFKGAFGPDVLAKILQEANIHQNSSISITMGVLDERGNFIQIPGKLRAAAPSDLRGLEAVSAIGIEAGIVNFTPLAPNSTQPLTISGAGATVGELSAKLYSPELGFYVEGALSIIGERQFAGLGASFINGGMDLSNFTGDLRLGVASDIAGNAKLEIRMDQGIFTRTVQLTPGFQTLVIPRSSLEVLGTKMLDTSIVYEGQNGVTLQGNLRLLLAAPGFTSDIPAELVTAAEAGALNQIPLSQAGQRPATPPTPFGLVNPSVSSDFKLLNLDSYDVSVVNGTSGLVLVYPDPFLTNNLTHYSWKLNQLAGVDQFFVEVKDTAGKVILKQRYRVTAGKDRIVLPTFKSFNLPAGKEIAIGVTHQVGAANTGNLQIETQPRVVTPPPGPSPVMVLDPTGPLTVVKSGISELSSVVASWGTYGGFDPPLVDPSSNLEGYRWVSTEIGSGKAFGLVLNMDDFTTPGDKEVGRFLDANPAGYVFAVEALPADGRASVVLEFNIENRIYLRTSIPANGPHKIFVPFTDTLKSRIDLNSVDSLALTMLDETGHIVYGTLKAAAAVSTDFLASAIIAPDGNLTSADITPLLGTALDPQSGATSPFIGTPPRGFILDYAIGDSGYRYNQLNWDNFNTPARETTDLSGISNFVIGIQGTPDRVKLEFVDESNKKVIVYLSGISPTAQKIWSLPKSLFASLDLAHLWTITVVVEEKNQAGSLEVQIRPTAAAPINADSFPTVQAAIDSAQPGDVVVLSAKTYHEQIVLKDGVTLQGQGPQAGGTILDFTGLLTPVTNSTGVNMASNSVLKGVKIINNTPVDDTGGISPLRIQDASNVTVDNVDVIHAGIFNVNNSKQVNVKNSFIEGYPHVAFLASNNSQVSLFNSTVLNKDSGVSMLSESGSNVSLKHVTAVLNTTVGGGSVLSTQTGGYFDVINSILHSTMAGINSTGGTNSFISYTDIVAPAGTSSGSVVFIQAVQQNVDPQFVNYGEDDFTLQPTSPLKNIGYGGGDLGSSVTKARSLGAANDVAKDFNVAERLDELKANTILYVDFRNIKAKQMNEAQLMELFGYALDNPEKVKLVIHNAVAGDEALEFFRDVENKEIVTGDINKAFAQFGAIGANIQLSKEGVDPAKDFTADRTKMKFFRYEAEETGLVAVALLYSELDKIQQKLAGLEEKGGYFYVVGQILQNLVQAYEAQLVVKRAA